MFEIVGGICRFGSVVSSGVGGGKSEEVPRRSTSHDLVRVRYTGLGTGTGYRFLHLAPVRYRPYPYLYTTGLPGTDTKLVILASGGHLGTIKTLSQTSSCNFFYPSLDPWTWLSDFSPVKLA